MQIAPIFDNVSVDQTEYYWFKNGFSEQECEWVENLANLYPNQINFDSEIRNSKIKPLLYDDLSEWLYDKFKTLAIEANNSIWKFDISSIRDAIQVAEYVEGVQYDSYNWFLDIGSNTNYRKISIEVQLSDPSKYEGGDLQIWSSGEFKTMPKFKGCVVLFPSFLLQRMTPITKGFRKSLILSVGGVSFR